MISLANLPTIITQRGANELLTLALSPTSQAVVGVLATRTHMTVERHLLEDCFDVYLCRDDESKNRVVIPSPFTIAVFPELLQMSTAQTFRMLDDVLSVNFVSDKPIVAISPHGLREFSQFVVAANLSLIDLGVGDLVDILIHRPARDALLKRVIPATSLKRLNPYHYKGPIRGNMFVGREEQLAKLTGLSESYALVGPRAIGKTSLINRAYEEIRSKGEVVVRLEFSTAMQETDLLVQIVERLIEGYEAWPGYRSRANIDRVSWLLEDSARKSPNKRIAILVDEADEIETRCPRLIPILKRMHNQDRARLVFVGYKQLRKAVYDSRKSDMMNVLTRLPLTRMSFRECGSLVLRPMMELGLEFVDPAGVQEAIHRLSGGAPSRVQMFCRAIVDSLSDEQGRTVRFAHDERDNDIPSLQD